jgi:O-antigen/teichoic acid export membrane protein
MSVAVLRGELRVGETAIVQVLQPLGWLICGYVLVVRGFGVTGLVYGYLIGTAAMLLAGWWKASVSLSRPTRRHARSLFDYSKYSVISAIGGYFYSWMDVALLTAFVSLGITATRAGVGAYENAWRVSLIVLLLSQSIATTIFPQISNWDAEDATDRIEAVIPTSLLPASLLIIPALAGTIVLSKDILRVLFGPEFTVAWLVLIVLMAEKILQGVHVVLGRSLQAIDRPDLAAYATVAAVVINLVLNILLIWQFGILGAAIATAVSFAVNTGLHAYYLNQFIDIELPIHETKWSVVASVVMGGCVYWVWSVVAIESMAQLFGIVAFGAVVYGIIILASARIRTRAIRIITKTLPNL